MERDADSRPIQYREKKKKRDEKKQFRNKMKTHFYSDLICLWTTVVAGTQKIA